MLNVLLILLVLIVNSFVIHFVKELDKKECECAKHKSIEKQYIKYYAIVTLGAVTIFYILPYLLNLGGKSLMNINLNLSKCLLSNTVKFLLELYLIGGLVNIMLLFYLTKKMKKSKCGCEDTFKRKFLFYYSLVIIAIYIVSFIISMELYINNRQ
jgi:hypothetical protein|tara:strand:+ start:3331 stop:3795 length:465 start_codon:yes stop_codon:yes gene_type:complete